MRVLLRMQRTRRTGWVKCGIEDAESIADHMYRMSLLALVIEDPEINYNKYLQ